MNGTGPNALVGGNSSKPLDTLGIATNDDSIDGKVNDINLYRYVGNNPTTFADATGLDRYIVTNGLHWWIVVEQWGMDAKGRPVVAGYTALDYSCFGFTVRPADQASAVNQWWSTNGPGAYGSKVLYVYHSNMDQDNALLCKWMELRRLPLQVLNTLGYCVAITCITMTDYWANYGGQFGPANGPFFYQGR